MKLNLDDLENAVLQNRMVTSYHNLCNGCEKKPMWEVVLSTIDPTIGRRRNFSIQALHTMTGLPVKQLFDDMKASGLVTSLHCPNVNVQVLSYYTPSSLSDEGRKSNREYHLHEKFELTLSSFPVETVKGFERKKDNGEPNPKDVPYSDPTLAFAAHINQNLIKEGYMPVWGPLEPLEVHG